MHQDEPAVGVVLGGAGLARHIGSNAVAAANAGARTLVNHAAHHVDQQLGPLCGDGSFCHRRLKRLQHPAVAIFHPRHQQRLHITPVIGQRAVAGDHFLQAHRAGAEGQRQHLVELALAHTRAARQAGHARRPHHLHDLGGDGVF